MYQYVPQTILCGYYNNTVIQPKIFNMYFYAPQTFYVAETILCMQNYCLCTSNSLWDAK